VVETAAQEPWELERAGWKALAAGGEAATRFYDAVLAGEVVFVFPGGMRIDDRDAVLASMGGAPWDAYELTDERIVVLGPESQVVTYVANGRRGTVEYRALVTSAYANVAGRWRLVLHQQTPF
jgi:hypothetical protein